MRKINKSLLLLSLFASVYSQSIKASDVTMVDFYAEESPVAAPLQQSFQVQSVQSPGYLENLIELSTSPKIERGLISLKDSKDCSYTVFSQLQTDRIFGPIEARDRNTKNWPQARLSIYDKTIMVFVNEILSSRGKARTIGEVKRFVDEKIINLKEGNEVKISLANTLRHLTHVDSPDLNTDLGDFAAEYALTEIINGIEDKRKFGPLDPNDELLLSNAYYQLSQTYAHLCVYEGKVQWEAQKGKLLITEKSEVKAVDEVDINFSTILKKRFELLKSAILLDPENHQAWARVGEFYLGGEYEFYQQYIEDDSIRSGLDFNEKGNYRAFLEKIIEATKDKNTHFADKKAISDKVIQLKKQEEKEEKRVVRRQAQKRKVMRMKSLNRKNIKKQNMNKRIVNKGTADQRTVTKRAAAKRIVTKGTVAKRIVTR